MMLHVLYNALGPVLTVIGLHMGALLGGTVLVEYVFNWPGLSTPLIRAVEGRDYPMVVGIVLTISGLFLLINLIVDLLRALLDPRLGQADGEAAAPPALARGLRAAARHRRAGDAASRPAEPDPAGHRQPAGRSPARLAAGARRIRPRRPFPAALGRAHQPLRRLRLGDDRGAGRHADRRGLRLAEGGARIPRRAARRHHPLLSADPAGAARGDDHGTGRGHARDDARDPLHAGFRPRLPRRDHRRALSGLRRRCRRSWRRPDAHRLAHAAPQHRKPPAGAIFADRRRGDRGRERPLFPRARRHPAHALLGPDDPRWPRDDGAGAAAPALALPRAHDHHPGLQPALRCAARSFRPEIRRGAHPSASAGPPAARFPAAAGAVCEGPQRREPLGRDHDAPRSHPAGRRRRFHGRAGRDARHRRRERVWQVADGHDPDGTAAARGPPRLRPRLARRCRSAAARPGGAPQIAWRRHRHDPAGSDEQPQPVAPRRRAGRRGDPRPPHALFERRAGRGAGALPPRRHRRPRATARLLAARDVGRHAPARDDRDGGRQPAGPPHRRRADNGARRDRAGPDPRPAGGSPA